MRSKKICSYHLLVFFLLILAFAHICHAGQSQYIYDDLGRLSRVIDQDGNYLFYEYDSVGNLTAINTGVTNSTPPALNSVNPDLLFIGARVPTTITGSNLITTKSLTTDPIMPVRILSISDTEIVMDITVPSDAQSGTPVVFTATTFYGTANISATLTSSQLVFSPGQLPIVPGSVGSVTASIMPAVGRALTITLNNSNPEIASAPDTLTIPSTGTTTFDVSALQEGVTTIDYGDVNTVVFVSDPFTPEPGEEVINTAGTVSVYIEAPTTADTTLSALPVSAYIETPAASDATTAAQPVSVYMETPVTTETTTSALPISVYINIPSVQEATVPAPPVSAQIGP